VGEFAIAPSEYWQMSPSEIQILIEAKRPKYVGGIHESDLESMYRRRQDLEEQGIKVM